MWPPEVLALVSRGDAVIPKMRGRWFFCKRRHVPVASHSLAIDICEKRFGRHADKQRQKMHVDDGLCVGHSKWMKAAYREMMVEVEFLHDAVVWLLLLAVMAAWKHMKLSRSIASNNG